MRAGLATISRAADILPWDVRPPQPTSAPGAVMPLRLSTQDQHALRGVMQTLLSPLDFADVDAWRDEVCRGTAALLGADKGAFMLLGAGVQPMHQRGMDPAGLDAYLAHFHALDGNERRRALGRPAALTERLYAPGEYRRTEYFNDFVVPFRLHHVLGLAVERGADTYAGLSFHHDRDTGPQFGDRELALAELLHPALRAGVDTVLHLHADRERLGAVLDAVGEPLLALDGAGRELHRNAALQRLLAAEPQRDRVLARMKLCAAAPFAPAEDPPRLELATAASRYRLRMTSAAQLAPGAVLVAAERTVPLLPTADQLRERFGLTPREAQVALRMAAGHSTKAIAHELGLSPSTTRHHGEHVFTKLGVRSRKALALHLLADLER